MTNVVSINGRDGSGKSLQRRLLGQCTDCVHLPPRESFLPKLDPQPLFDWWFQEVPIDELMEALIRQLDAGYRHPGEGKVKVIDRGSTMYRATCAAVLQLRTGCSLDVAREYVDSYFDRYWGSPGELEIWLRPDPHYMEVVRRYPDAEPQPSYQNVDEPREEIYQRYKGLLAGTVESYVSHLPESRIIPVDAPAAEVQNRVRSLLRQELELPLPEFARSFRLIVGFSGLSESGKSSHAEHLRRRHGFARLKLKHFSANLQGREEPSSNIGLALEILRFMADHTFVDKATIESIHGRGIAGALKQLLGDRFQLVFMEAPLPTRIRRFMRETLTDHATATQAVMAKDAAKRESGADLLREIADIVWDNSGSRRPSELSRALLINAVAA